ncbi:translocon-associated protein subunit beta isoform X1 [Microtus ochrogaster]|uniref:Translocon-associated protein subunit beta isoform X1 n=1 Tax=Microtus ochrogaster TaxID=79684 RepID=A0ABM1UDF8_MICOH|nr:translocon-associated protein subunit beta isoform X1 [Microtus ochrogaster]
MLTLFSGCLWPRMAFGVPTMRPLAFVVLALLAVSQGEEGARLLASKSLLNRYAVEGRDLTLQYNIYNVGSSAALDVELSDDSFPPEDFGIVSGMLNVKWDRIAPASNVSHTVVLRPLKAGYFNFTSATITYLAQEDGPVVIGSTSAPGQGGILAQREFDRRFSPHFVSLSAGLGSLWSHDLALHRHPPSPVVLQQEEIRYSQTQEELSAASSTLLSRSQVFSRLHRVADVFPWPVAILSWILTQPECRGQTWELASLPVLTEAIKQYCL